MAAEAHSLNKKRASIQSMFDAIAPRYDLLNRLLSARQDVAWRKKAARAVELSPGARVLDLCCGTGDQALALERERYRVIAADFSIPMTDLATSKFACLERNRPTAMVADALCLPVSSPRFEAVTVSFGLRNVENLEAALKEIYRALEPGGKLVALEFAVPTGGLVRPVYLYYFENVLPRIGQWLSPRGSAYTYLTESVPSFPQRGVFTEQMENAGFEEATWRDLSGGIVCLYSGRRSE